MATSTMPTLMFPEYAPDLITLGGEGSPEIFGAVPLVDGTTFRVGSEPVRFELAALEPPTKTAAP